MWCSMKYQNRDLENSAPYLAKRVSSNSRYRHGAAHILVSPYLVLKAGTMPLLSLAIVNFHPNSVILPHKYIVHYPNILVSCIIILLLRTLICLTVAAAAAAAASAASERVNCGMILCPEAIFARCVHCRSVIAATVAVANWAGYVSKLPLAMYSECSTSIQNIVLADDLRESLQLASEWENTWQLLALHDRETGKRLTSRNHISFRVMFFFSPRIASFLRGRKKKQKKCKFYLIWMCWPNIEAWKKKSTYLLCLSFLGEERRLPFNREPKKQTHIYDNLLLSNARKRKYLYVYFFTWSNLGCMNGGHWAYDV